MNSSTCYNLRCWTGDTCPSSTACVNHWGVLNTTGCKDLVSNLAGCATGCVNAMGQNSGPRIRRTVLGTCDILVPETWFCDFKSYSECKDPAMLFDWATDSVTTRYRTAENIVSDSLSTMIPTSKDSTTTTPSTTTRNTVSFQSSAAPFMPSTSSSLLTPIMTSQVAYPTALPINDRPRVRPRQSVLAIHVAFGACGGLLVSGLVCVMWWMVRQRRRRKKAKEEKREALDRKGIPRSNGYDEPVARWSLPNELPNECVKPLELSTSQDPGELA